MSMNQLSALLGAGGGGAPPVTDTPQVDTAEQIYVSSLALIKMLKHGAPSSALCQPRVGVKNVHRSCVLQPFGHIGLQPEACSLCCLIPVAFAGCMWPSQ